MRVMKGQLMGNGRETLIPSRLKYRIPLCHQTNNSELKSIIRFNAFLCNSAINHLWVDITHRFVVKKVGIIIRC